MFVSIQDGDRYLFATAGEDTDINLVSIAIPNRDSSDDLSCHDVIATLKGHLSSVRTLSLSGKQNLRLTYDTTKTTKVTVNREVTDYSVSDEDASFRDGSTLSKPNAKADKADCACVLFSAGGRAEIKAWKIHRTTQEHSTSALATQKENETTQQESCDTTSNSGNPRSHSSTIKQPTTESKIWHEFLATHSLSGKFRVKYKPWKHKKWDPDPESRYMDLASFQMCSVIARAPRHLHCVVAACSDGFVRVFSFNEKTRKFLIIAQSDFHDHCVLKVRHIITRKTYLNSLTDSVKCEETKQTLAENTSKSAENAIESNSDTMITEHDIYVISTGTDGRFALWDITALIQACVSYELNGLTENDQDLRTLKSRIDVGDIMNMDGPVFSTVIHQSGVNAIDVLLIPGEL